MKFEASGDCLAQLVSKDASSCKQEMSFEVEESQVELANMYEKLLFVSDRDDGSKKLKVDNTIDVCFNDLSLSDLCSPEYFALRQRYFLQQALNQANERQFVESLCNLNIVDSQFAAFQFFYSNADAADPNFLKMRTCLSDI